MKRLIIDCDPGNGIAGANTDDGLALSLALASPGLSLELITTVAGNTPSDVGARVAKDLVTRLGCAVPVVQGARQALCEDPGPWRAVLDKRVEQLNLLSLWQGVPQPAMLEADATDAAQAMGQLICDNPGEITLIAIGPLTNVALAMQRFPDMAESVAEIVIMGGVFALDDYIKDTNFGIDPEAAHQVLHSGAAITLLPMDVTTQTLLTQDDLTRMTCREHPLTRFVHDTLQPWIDYSMQTRQLAGCWIHDALVVAWLLNQRVAWGTDYRVDIELRPGATRGKTWRYRQPLRLDVGIPPDAGALVHVLHSVDNALLLSIIEQAFNHLPE
ncbi:hydrolase [Pantoea ananatis]|jgi:inosine-uridine nucleoside N-ribohydrolase|uniref:Nucleoside hydrolase n=1 Tax=Pantoea ananas TaxID=553 RepID=A0A8A4KHT9_PANAN|nr:nucleoside hydrolase [Pantoea ananatis]MDC7865281.1 hydrolase [Pantoea ananatis]QAB31801.1 nucleoside hydrolase [Pantoea ananatis]QTC45806.1 nucleoside hydrolase [Pantoea ananatis]URL16408.1 nucleoside hydrolase [Pantoea ananatis]CRH32448.1 Inosine-uridine preferring nucleoside hydrolase YeiK [Pantoea ananatis]